MTKGKQWLSQEESTREYLEQCMLRINNNEYLKIWEAIYDFNILPLERISFPTLVLNGEYELKSTVHHTQEILRRVQHAKAEVIPSASHASNIDNPKVFNRFMEDFINHST